MKVSIANIAAQAGVSPGTASLVLNNRFAKQRISEQTAARVMEVAQRLNYRPNYAARALASKRTNMIGLICGGLESPFFTSLSHMILQAAKTHQCRLLNLPTDWGREEEWERLQMMLDYSVDGIIIRSEYFTDECPVVAQLKTEQTPLVLLGRIHRDFPSIITDFQPGMNAAFELLLRTGHRRIALLRSFFGNHPWPDFPAGEKTVFPDDIAFYYNQTKGNKVPAYLNCCRRYGIEPQSCGFDLDRQDAVAKIIADRKINAVISDSDYNSMILTQMLHGYGVRVPEDLSLVSIDDTYLSEISTVPLTAIRQDKKAMAELSVNYILDKRSGKPAPQLTVLPTTLIERGTVINRHK